MASARGNDTAESIEEAAEDLEQLEIEDSSYVNEYIIIKPMPRPPNSKSTKTRHPRISLYNHVYFFHRENKKTGVTIWRCRDGELLPAV